MEPLVLDYIFNNFDQCFSRQALVLCGSTVALTDINATFKEAKQRYLYCLSKKKIKHQPSRIWLHADEYASFLVFLARQCYLDGFQDVAEIVYLINRRLHSFECFYTRELPTLFHLEHPVGTVLGPATYGERLVVYQGVTVGGDVKERYPTIENDVVLYANSTLIGVTHVGTNCAIGSGVQLYSRSVAPGTAVSCRDCIIHFKPLSWSVSQMFFN